MELRRRNKEAKDDWVIFGRRSSLAPFPFLGQSISPKPIAVAPITRHRKSDYFGNSFCPASTGARATP